MRPPSDPIGLKGGINTYSYVQQRPLSWIDPRGLTGSYPYPAVCAGNPRIRGGIACDGKGGFLPYSCKSDCMTVCTLAHEMVHAFDWRGVNPNACRNIPMGHTMDQSGSTMDLDSGPIERPDHKNKREHSECRAMQVGRKCTAALGCLCPDQATKYDQHESKNWEEYGCAAKGYQW